MNIDQIAAFVNLDLKRISYVGATLFDLLVYLHFFQTSDSLPNHVVSKFVMSLSMAIGTHTVIPSSTLVVHGHKITVALNLNSYFGMLHVMDPQAAMDLLDQLITTHSVHFPEFPVNTSYKMQANRMKAIYKEIRRRTVTSETNFPLNESFYDKYDIPRLPKIQTDENRFIAYGIANPTVLTERDEKTLGFAHTKLKGLARYIRNYVSGLINYQIARNRLDSGDERTYRITDNQEYQLLCSESVTCYVACWFLEDPRTAMDWFKTTSLNVLSTSPTLPVLKEDINYTHCLMNRNTNSYPVKFELPPIALPRAYYKEYEAQSSMKSFRFLRKYCDNRKRVGGYIFHFQIYLALVKHYPDFNASALKIHRDMIAAYLTSWTVVPPLTTLQHDISVATYFGILYQLSPSTARILFDQIVQRVILVILPKSSKAKPYLDSSMGYTKGEPILKLPTFAVDDPTIKMFRFPAPPSLKNSKLLEMVFYHKHDVESDDMSLLLSQLEGIGDSVLGLASVDVCEDLTYETNVIFSEVSSYLNSNECLSIICNIYQMTNIPVLKTDRDSVRVVGDVFEQYLGALYTEDPNKAINWATEVFKSIRRMKLTFGRSS